MRFVDEVHIRIASGRGGDGSASFRREKYVPLGGPDGGDGGRGGDVVFYTDSGCNTLLDLRGHAIWQAKNGEPGGQRQRNGKSADSVEIRVPVGTRIYDDDDGRLIADLVEPGVRVVLARGGDGGRGNVHFKSATNQAPTQFTPGFPGVERHLRLELALMADVGLLGFPNAGKSTLISRLSAARPKVANYPFTTLAPSLGVVDMGFDGSFVIADIPGLIRGASDGAGLGHRFLRHLSRTRILLHLISVGPDEADPPVERYQAIQAELAAYGGGLSRRPQLVLLTKVDLLGEEELAEICEQLVAELGETPLLLVSSATRQGLEDLRLRCWTEVLARRLEPLWEDEEEGASFWEDEE